MGGSLRAVLKISRAAQALRKLLVLGTVSAALAILQKPHGPWRARHLQLRTRRSAGESAIRGFVNWESRRSHDVASSNGIRCYTLAGMIEAPGIGTLVAEEGRLSTEEAKEVGSRGRSWK